MPNKKNQEQDTQIDMQIIPLLLIEPQKAPTIPVCHSSVWNEIEYPTGEQHHNKSKP
jgi:hypothetical protein